MKTKVLFITVVVVALFSCKKEKNTDPVLETNVVKALSASTFYIKATVSEKGSYSILDYGFVYSLSNQLVSIENGTKISLGKALVSDTFSTTFSIDNNSYYAPTYYVRAYITNTKGTVYGSTLSVQPLTLSVLSVFPKSGKAGDSITITGVNFSPTPDDNVVKFNTTTAKLLEASTTKLIVKVPGGIQSNYYDTYIVIYVGTGNQTINASNFTLETTITGFSPKNGTFGTNVTLTGENLYGASIKCNDEYTYTYSTSYTSLSFSIPNSIKAEKVKIKVVKNYIETLAGDDFTMNPLSVSSVDPQKGYAGTTISVTGINLNPAGYDYASLKVGGVQVTSIYNSSSTVISGPVPALSAGTYDVEVNNGISSSILSNAFTVIVPKVTSFSPTSGTYGSQVTILGENLANNAYVTICSGEYNCNYANIVSQDSSKIIITIPYGLSSGEVKLHVYSWVDLTFADDFTIEPLTTTITDFIPDSGTPGTEITINGSGFVQGYTDVKFGTVSATILSITSTVIKAQVPSNAGSGAMKISVVILGNTVVSGNDFTIL